MVTVTGCMVVDIPGGGVGCSEMKLEGEVRCSEIGQGKRKMDGITAVYKSDRT